MLSLKDVPKIIEEFEDQKITKLKLLFFFQALLEMLTLLIVMNLINLAESIDASRSLNVVLNYQLNKIKILASLYKQEQILFFCLFTILFLFFTLVVNIIINYKITSFSYI